MTITRINSNLKLSSFQSQKTANKITDAFDSIIHPKPLKTWTEDQQKANLAQANAKAYGFARNKRENQDAKTLSVYVIDRLNYGRNFDVDRLRSTNIDAYFFENDYGSGSAQRFFDKNHALCAEKGWGPAKELLYQDQFFKFMKAQGKISDPNIFAKAVVEARSEAAKATNQYQYTIPKYEKDNHQDRPALERKAAIELEKLKNNGRSEADKQLFYNVHKPLTFDAQYNINDEICESRGYDPIQKYTYQNEFFKFYTDSDKFDSASYGATIAAYEATTISGKASLSSYIKKLYNGYTLKN